MIRRVGEPGPIRRASRQWVSACSGSPRLRRISPRVAWTSDEAGSSRARLAELLKGRDPVTLEIQGMTQADAGDHEVGSQPDGLVEVDERGVEIPASHEGRAEVAQDARARRIEPERGLARRNHLVDPTERPVRLGKIGMKRGRVRPERDCLADQFGGPTGFSALEGHEAEKMKGIRLVRLLGQRRLAKPGGPFQIAPLVVLQRLAQVDGHRSRRSRNGGKLGANSVSSLDRFATPPVNALRQAQRLGAEVLTSRHVGR